MSRPSLLDRDPISEESHQLFTDDYFGDRHIFCVWAYSPEILETTLEYLDTLYEQPGDRRNELVVSTVGRKLQRSTVRDTDSALHSITQQ